MTEATLTVARHGYTCRQTTQVHRWWNDGSVNKRATVIAQHVDAEGVTRKGCGVDTRDYPAFAAHMAEAHNVKPARQSKTYGAPGPAGTNGFKPVRLTQLERDWLGVDVTVDRDYTSAEGDWAGQVWAQSDSAHVWYVVRPDRSYFAAHVSELARVEPVSVDVELPLAV